METVSQIPRRKETLALVRKLPATGTALQLRVIAVEGDCAWGYHEVDRWTVDPDGWLTPNLCQAAAIAVSKAGNTNWKTEREVSCRCPVMPDRRDGCGCPAEDRRVTFGVRPAEQAETR